MTGPTARSRPDDPLDTDGLAAPPRANGELVFTEPWQSRLFGTTMRLWEARHFEWDRFRQGLIDQIGIHQRDLADDPDRSPDRDYDYWGCWQRALEDLVEQLGLIDRQELSSQAAALAARPAGHDHPHTHTHDHHHDHH